MPAISGEWLTALSDEFKKEYYKKLFAKVNEEYKTQTIFPPANDIFNAFHYAPLNEVKVVILGQDPYHGEGEANGLAFADQPKPMKLENGFIKYEDTIPDTWIFDFQNIETVRIARPDKTPAITMNCGQFPLLAVWANPTGSFICLEPWFGRSDNDGFTGTIDEKVAEQQLEAGETKKISHTVEFHK